MKARTCLSPPPPAAFTLPDLLAVIGVLLLLGAFLVPAHASSRPHSRSFQCLNHLRQLVCGWRMYAEEHADKVPNNFSILQTQAEISSQGFRNWVNNVMDWTSAQLNTNLLVLQRGPIAPYVAADTAMYKCPADVYLSAQQRALGWTARTRSYSMNAFFGPYTTNPSDPWGSGRNSFFSSYRQWLKISQVARPAGSFVFIEEHPDSINDGLFLNDPSSTTQWGDIPASHHENAGGLSFADGHAEMHKWQSSRSRIPVRFSYGSSVLDSLGRTDYQWLMARTATLF